MSPEYAMRTASRIGADARKLYAGGAMCCSEAVLDVINREFNGGLPNDLVPALSRGFCGGMGDAGCACGALTGAIMAQSLILGKTPFPADDKQVRAATKKLHDLFSARHGSTCCRILSRDRDPDSEHKGVCLGYVESAASLCASLLLVPDSAQGKDQMAGHETAETDKNGFKPVMVQPILQRQRG